MAYGDIITLLLQFPIILTNAQVQHPTGVSLTGMCGCSFILGTVQISE